MHITGNSPTRLRKHLWQRILRAALFVCTKGLKTPVLRSSAQRSGGRRQKVRLSGKGKCGSLHSL
ncbi:hypothetical protein GCM10010946_27210 [Undibacterium squillarum]|uniref:Uncharacterized protein n=1 Tax=Undibacterium squillarum TaxID=1131567 RepID=A0ABQ2Y1D8_9BURK|nr:hypothetical protein GCM10010946_27210 [Undibacterium squillarum]